MALVLLIPPVRAESNSALSCFSVIFAGGAILAFSLLVGRLAGRDPVWKIAFQAVIFIVYGLLLMHRVQM
ncbi:MAG: hypothetical protein ABS95_01440 [Verrucomicrobia bacterium SCN 57-15]|nr:MAG: hypothetical protein ABS95_01440 [Verrucomicrobia bacterium SCN 57-15]